MYDYKKSLKEIGEIGEVQAVWPSMVYISGLPQIKPNELVVFENGELGVAFSIFKEKVGIILLSHSQVKVGDKLARTGKPLSLKVSDELLGKVVDSMGTPINTKENTFKVVQERNIDIIPLPLSERKMVTDPLETGVAIVDLLIPIAKGQRELVIGDRKTGKTQFFVRTLINHATKGNICVYASVGKKIVEIKEMLEALKKSGADKNTVVVATSASDSPGLVFVTPYTAMTIAEYFRDQGRDVVVILDDLTNHAMYYREISLLSGRFPGRSSYPGDIFYIHSKLLERAGNFKKGSITCFPVAESILGDWSGYIQTNLMSITDGHIFFDTEFASLGRHPAINPFLSVTRVGQQAQSNLLRELSHELNSFLITLEKLRDFEHFGAELSEEILQKLALGDRILVFFDQPKDIVPINVSVLILSMLWIGSWRNQKRQDMRAKFKKMIDDYQANTSFKKNIDGLILKSDSFKDFLNSLRETNYGQENYY